MKTNVSVKVLLFLTLLGALLFANTINNPFVFDDLYNIQDNPAVHNLKFFIKYFIDPGTHNVLPENAPYRPLMTLSNALLWAVAKGATWPFHVYKIASHILMAWLIFLISSTLMKKILSVHTDVIAFTGAVFFLVHPALSEPVNYISSTSTLQCSLFYLLAFFFALKRRHLPMAACFLLSVLSKEEGVTFPGALALYYLVFERESLFSKSNLKTFAYALVPWAFYLLVYLNLPQAVQFSQTARDIYFFTQMRAWVYYLVGIVTPWGYSIEHMEFGFSETFWNAAVILSLIANAVFIFIAARWALGKQLGWRRYLGFGFLWFYLTLLPASSVFPLAEPINEHRYYLSYALLLPALCVALFSLPKVSTRALHATAIIIGITLSALTFAQNRLWQDAESIWTNAVQQDPSNGRAHLNLGLSILRKGRFNEVRAHLDNCVKYRPGYLYCFVNLGVYHSVMNQMPEARKAYEKAVELAPNSVVALAFLGEHLVIKERRFAEAIPPLQRCDVVAQGRNSRCLYHLAYGLRELKRYDESLAAAQRLVALTPENKEARFELGLSLIFTNRLSDAQKLFDDELKRDENEVNALQNLAWIAMQQKNWLLAKELWQRKLKLQPNHSGAWKNLRETAVQLNDAALIKTCDAELKKL